MNIQNYYCQWKRMRLFHGDQYVIEDEEGHYFPLEICFVCISHTNPKRLGCPGADTEW